MTKEEKKAARAAAKAATQAAAQEAEDAGDNYAESEGDDEAAELTTAQKMTKQLRAARVRYLPTTSSSGNKSLHNGDEIAALLAGRTVEETYEIVEGKLGLKPGTLAAKYANLNPGQQRMNAGNRLRAAAKRGEVEV
jgi:hypothetical protein